jgi:hypothetical protein
MGSETKTIVAVDMTSSQDPGIVWDTDPALDPGHWLLGIFDGGPLNDLGDGSIYYEDVSDTIIVTLYASDTYPASLFPPDEHTRHLSVGLGPHSAGR